MNKIPFCWGMVGELRQGLAAGCEVFMWAQINGYETVQERRYKICITAISV